MRIADFHVTPIAIADPPLLNAAGLHAPYALRAIVEVVSNDNIYGVSELPGGADVLADLESVRHLVVGRDPFRLNVIARDIEAHFGGATSGDRQHMRTTIHSRRAARAFGAVEVACLDLIGKAIGRPVCDLLGGKVRDRVPFSAYLFYKYEGAGGELGFAIDPKATGWAAARQAAALTPDGIVAQAQAMCREFGFKSLKLKGGVFEPQIEVDTIFALRKAFGPNTPLRLDPNAVWSVETAIEYGRQLEGALEYLEDPTRGQEGMAQVAKAVNIPLATNMCTTSFDDIPGSVRLGSEHIILSDHHFWGGLRASVELACICRTFGRGLSMHSNSHVGISLRAMAHLAAAVPNLTYACDTHYPWQCEEVIVGGRLQFDDGDLIVGDAPGLGVELDRAMLAKLHANYLKCGLTKRDDEAEMQKVQPGWKFVETRW
ncbi:MAG: glucarate dehydratase [Candidatus Roseilinea sp.]|nr:MAG: glucarate dehydratase [Candidatus Roseilinea sp.]